MATPGATERMLLCCVRAAVGTGPPPADWPPAVDPDALIRQAQRHEVAAMVYQVLLEARIRTLDEDATRTL